jgi:hypothetical protein
MISKTTLSQVKKESKLVYYLIITFNKLLDKKAVRDLGKILAEANEYILMDWINENTLLEVNKRDDNDLNASGYDLITLDKLMKIQGKIRVDSMHLEQTRRKSIKNKDSSDTGHVAYSVGEADVYLISRPNRDDYANLGKWCYIAIPEEALIDPKNPNFLITSIPKKIWSKYVGITEQVLTEVYNKLVNKHEKILINS